LAPANPSMHVCGQAYRLRLARVRLGLVTLT
jgi:hypothetical protein